MLVSYLQANPDYKGVCHVALAQEGHCRPGEVLFSPHYRVWKHVNRYRTNQFQLLSRFSLVPIRIRAMPEHLVSLQLELVTLMQALCWALERLFSRYANFFCYPGELQNKPNIQRLDFFSTRNNLYCSQ
jgi:hypothetical protein